MVDGVGSMVWEGFVEMVSFEFRVEKNAKKILGISDSAATANIAHLTNLCTLYLIIIIIIIISSSSSSIIK